MTDNKIAITKAQLKSLQPHYGKVNSDNGQVFLAVQGHMHADRLYHVEVIDRAPLPTEQLEQFSLTSLLESDTNSSH